MKIKVDMETAIEDLNPNECSEVFEALLTQIDKDLELTWAEETYQFYSFDDECFTSIRKLISQLSDEQKEDIISDISDES